MEGSRLRRFRRSPVGTRRGAWIAVLVCSVSLLVACGGGSPDESEEGDGAAGGAELTAAERETDVPATDSLVVIFRSDSIPVHRVPGDWFDLLHPRLSGQVGFPDPAVHDAARRFMEAVLLGEARRTGDPRAGFDWLRRLDRVVAVYYRDPRDAAIPLRRGELVVVVAPAALASRLLQEPSTEVAGMTSGGTPSWFSPYQEDVAAKDGSVAVPPNWMETWRAEIRGRR